MQTVNRSALVGSSSLLAGKPVFQARPASGKAGRSVGSVTVAAEVLLRHNLHDLCMRLKYTAAYSTGISATGRVQCHAVIVDLSDWKLL